MHNLHSNGQQRYLVVIFFAFITFLRSIKYFIVLQDNLGIISNRIQEDWQI